MKNILIVFTLILITSCSKDNAPVDYTTKNDEDIQAYIAENNLNAQKSSTGLYYIIDEQGNGENPIATDRVKVAYKGYLTNGTVFDESVDGFSFSSLQNLIPGWIEGLSYFSEGGKGKLLIPAHLAYGGNNNGAIPAGSVIIFDIELIYVNYETENDEEIQTYIADNDLVAEKTSSGLYYTMDVVGEGTQPTITDNVSITYKGYFTNGNIFDESSQSVNFDLKNLITGFSEGITYFKEGGSGTLIIPSHLAYGNTDVSVIPGGSVIIFDIELLSVN